MLHNSKAHKNMVLSQIRTAKTQDITILETFLEIPKEIFLPKNYQEIPYTEDNLMLSASRYMLSNPIIARMISLAEIKPTYNILELGCNTGYTTAILSKLAEKITAIESEPKLASQATHTVHGLGIDNAILIAGDIQQGHPEGAPYDVIFISGLVEDIPQCLVEQLKENGKIVTILPKNAMVGSIAVGTKKENTLHTQCIEDVTIMNLPPLIDNNTESVFEL